MGLPVCHIGLEPRTSRQGPKQVLFLLLTRASLALDRRCFWKLPAVNKEFWHRCFSAKVG